ncbi:MULTISPECIES: TetR family transcriptional regulator, partial [Frankia]|uniref:TetR-family transcriptional regulator n=2 Tax=Frankia TaxID=1854 RepID=Q0RU28_FRAAA
MEEISRRAGLATATVYRRFPTRAALAAAAFAEQLAACGNILDLALAAPDPWRGFCRFVLRLCPQPPAPIPARSASRLRRLHAGGCARLQPRRFFSSRAAERWLSVRAAAGRNGQKGTGTPCLTLRTSGSSRTCAR